MIIACGMPFHIGEVALVGGGALAGALLVGRLCWNYLRGRFSKTSCQCDCCDHDEPKEE